MIAVADLLFGIEARSNSHGFLTGKQIFELISSFLNEQLKERPG
jgi:hypothetical protein